MIRGHKHLKHRAHQRGASGRAKADRHVAEAEVILAAVDPALDIAMGAHVKREFHLRIFLRETCHGRGDHRQGGAGHCHHTQAFGAVGANLVGDGGYLSEACKNAVGFPVEGRAFFCQQQAFFLPLEQREPEFRLQNSNQPAHGRLAQMHGARRAADRSFRDDGLECL